MAQHIVFLTLGALFIAGLAADTLGRRTRLPRVTLLLACGVVVGRSGLDLLPAEVQGWYELLTVLALTMVAFLLGGVFRRGTLTQYGREILVISLCIVGGTVAVVAGGLWLLGLPLAPALMLGAIAAATDPAAVEDVVHESGRKGGFPDKLKGIVAVDDAWGIIAFSVVLAVAAGIAGEGGSAALGHAVRELGGGIALGVAMGLPAAYLTGRLRRGEPMQSEALGVVFLIAGFAEWFEVSFLVAGMVAGAVVVNFARHHDRPFHEIEHIRWPFMMLFFLLAGASLQAGRFVELGVIGAGYVVLRVVGRIAGSWIGAGLGGAPAAERPWFGVGLLPQAGVAVGMALVAAGHFPDYSGMILTLTIGTTVAFELVGPPLTQWALNRAQRSD
ncbi:sodium:proton antiporter [Rhodobacteraceae bacterium WD3A24]|nr:sodium:proton antiporter [Rhodobacteraceae bacterium WD3A24]